MQTTRNSKCPEGEVQWKEIREFLEKHKLCADRNTVHRLKKEVKEVNCDDFIFIEYFLGFVSSQKVTTKRWKRGQRAQSSGEVTGWKSLQESLCWSHAKQGCCCIVNQPCVFLDDAKTFLTPSSRRVAMSCI